MGTAARQRGSSRGQTDSASREKAYGQRGNTRHTCAGAVLRGGWRRHPRFVERCGQGRHGNVWRYGQADFVASVRVSDDGDLGHFPRAAAIATTVARRGPISVPISVPSSALAVSRLVFVSPFPIPVPVPVPAAAAIPVPAPAASAVTTLRPGTSKPQSADQSNTKSRQR